MSLTLQQLWAIAGTSKETFKTLRRRSQLALSFGRSDAYESLTYIPPDGVCLLATERLARAYDRSTARNLVIAYWDVLALAISVAENQRDMPVQFCIVDLIRLSDRKTGTRAFSTVLTDADAAKQFVSDLQKPGEMVDGLHCVNISSIVQTVRDNAAKAGIDLSASFMPPPNDPRFNELISDYADKRDRFIASREARRSREGLAKRAGETARGYVTEMALRTLSAQVEGRYG